MSFAFALRASEILMALAFIQQSLEHLSGPRADRPLFALRLGLSTAVLAGIGVMVCLSGLFVIAIWQLHRFQGPYNGGADKMSLLILTDLTLVHVVPQGQWKEAIFGYLAVQLLLSYFISGQVKIVNAQWRSGQALADVFDFSAYPVSDALRNFAKRKRLMWAMSWAVMLFELIFPFTALSHPSLIVALLFGAAFHLANACLFGLNRFFWIWLAAYPSILWLQTRLIG